MHAARKICVGFKRNGQPCGSSAVGPDGLCFWHSPRVSPEEQHAAAVKGGLMNRPKAAPDSEIVKLRSPESCLALLEDTATRLRRGELDVKIANALAYNVSAAVKVWEVTISDKLDRLEKLVNGRAGRR